LQRDENLPRTKNAALSFPLAARCEMHLAMANFQTGAFHFNALRFVNFKKQCQGLYCALADNWLYCIERNTWSQNKSILMDLIDRRQNKLLFNN
jgi:hypothetical protein